MYFYRLVTKVFSDKYRVMRINLIFVLLLLVISGCAGMRHMADDLAGTYYGYLPCVNCPGIYYELRLDPDMNYRETILYDGLMEEPVIREHRYRITRDSIITLRGNYGEERMNQFAIRNDRLEMLSPDGERIETGFPERYILTKERHEPSFPETTITGFRAFGHNPAWNLEMKFGEAVKFAVPSSNGFEFIAHQPEPEKSDDLSSVKYIAKAHNGEFHITIERGECIEDSGEMLPFRVHVAARRSHRESFRRFEGCGEYLGVHRLNDHWVLKEINDKPVEMPESKDHPTLLIDIPGNTIMGFGGCNSFSGGIELVNNRLVTGRITSTKKACIDTQHIEERFLGTISDKTLDYFIEDSMLILGDGITKLTFSRHP